MKDIFRVELFIPLLPMGSFINHAIRRHFWWYENICWEDDIQVPILVTLAMEDDVVPSSQVAAYLASAPQRGPERHTIKLEGIGHGGFLTNSAAQEKVIDGLLALWN